MPQEVYFWICILPYYYYFYCIFRRHFGPFQCDELFGIYQVENNCCRQNLVIFRLFDQTGKGIFFYTKWKMHSIHTIEKAVIQWRRMLFVVVYF